MQANPAAMLDGDEQDGAPRRLQRGADRRGVVAEPAVLLAQPEEEVDGVVGADAGGHRDDRRRAHVEADAGPAEDAEEHDHGDDDRA